MKRVVFLIFIISLIVSTGACIQGQNDVQQANLPVDPDTKKITYKAVVEEPGKVAYLYDQAVGWFRYFYLNPASVYSVQDKVNGKIEGTGRMKVFFKDDKSDMLRDGGQIWYLIKIELKENKYRYTITDFTLKTTSRSPIEKWMNKNDPAYNPAWDSYLYQVDTAMQRLVTTMKEKMKPAVIKKDEW